MKILHASDIHLGIGKGQRLYDVYDSFKWVCDNAVHCDVLLLTGDLFHALRLDNETLAFCGRLLRKIRKQVKVVAVGGNHDSPKRIDSISPYDVIEDCFCACAVTDYQYIDIGHVRFHLVPFAWTKEALWEHIYEARDNRSKHRLNFLAMHVSVDRFEALKYDSVLLNHEEIELLESEFDHIALGHYHDHRKVSEKSYYAGSLERLTWNEVDYDRGFYIIEVGDDKKVKGVETTAYEPREMLELEPVDIDTSDAPTITDAILDGVSVADIQDKICRRRVMNVPATLYGTVDFRRISKFTESAMKFDLKFDIVEDVVEQDAVEQPVFGSIMEEWVNYCDEGDIKSSIMELGRDFIGDLDEA